VQSAIRRQALDRRHCRSILHYGERQAGIYAAPVHPHRTGAALAVIASLLRSRQSQFLAQRIEQRHPCIDRKAVLPPIDLKRDIADPGIHMFSHCSGCLCGCRRDCRHHGQGRRTRGEKAPPAYVQYAFVVHENALPPSTLLMAKLTGEAIVHRNIYDTVTTLACGGRFFVLIRNKTCQ